MTAVHVALEWTPYIKRVERSRVLEFVAMGRVEYELCGEGGQWVIRRTDRTNGPTVVTESSRGRPRDVQEVWRRIWLWG
ncbi:hypothetical protein [Nonomuraea sp. NPDC049028]|uniref:hypothetical protein n=1 Tax=Nonomuraea sp. NPDC049028 TaxID=3364348 RepID=UPI00371C5910